jgi:DTW domain-containing protein YfiP
MPIPMNYLVARAICAGCGRPANTCLCAYLVTIPTETRVVVLQHPRESLNAIGTAWIVARCLPRSERIVGFDLDNDARVRAALSHADAPPILLSPGADARDLHAEPPVGPVTLVVIDGTWTQAKKLLRINPELARLPRYAFTPSAPSNYRIRREPQPDFVSTLEATVEALELLESRDGRDARHVRALLGAFDAMVEHQLRFARSSTGGRYAKASLANGAPRVRRREATLDLGAARDLVVAHGEASAWPKGSEFGAQPEIVHFAAERLRSGERFEAFIAPDRPLPPSFRCHTDIAPERVLAGESRAAFRERWTAFLRSDDALGMWGYYVIDLLRKEGATMPARIDLRGAAVRCLKRRAGEADEFALAFGRPPPPPWAAGRTGVRLAAACAVARALLAGDVGVKPS